MQKRLLAIMILSILLAAYAHPFIRSEAAQAKPASPYEVITKIYSNRDIQIKYPQLTGLKDQQRQKKINRLLKKQALKVLTYYPNVEKKLSLEINYDIKRKSPKILSVVYRGVGYVKKAAYPNNLFYTTNMDIKKGKILQLKDIVHTTPNLIEKLKIKSKSDHPAYKDMLNSRSNEEWIDTLKGSDTINADISSDTFSYITKNHLGISISVPHVLGDHMELEIKLSDIKEGMKEDIKEILF